MKVRNERAWTHGPSWELTSVPAGFTHAVLVITGGWGIRNTLKKYGQFMLKAKGTKRLRDPSLKYLGVFTDNGAFYDAGWWPAFQSTSHDASATFKNLSESYKQLDIPVHYIQLDDWWYANATAHNLTQSGIVACTQSFAPTSANGSDVGAPLFPQGLRPLQKQFGGGLMLYMVNFCPSSPYLKREDAAVSFLDAQGRVFMNLLPAKSEETYGALLDRGVEQGITMFETDRRTLLPRHTSELSLLRSTAG